MTVLTIIRPSRSWLRKVTGLTVSEVLLSGSWVALWLARLTVGGGLDVRNAGQDFRSRLGLDNNSEKRTITFLVVSLYQRTGYWVYVNGHQVIHFFSWFTFREALDGSWTSRGKLLKTVTIKFYVVVLVLDINFEEIGLGHIHTVFE